MEESSEQEAQNRSHSPDHQSPQNDTASQSPQSGKTLGFVKPQCSEPQTTPLPSFSGDPAPLASVIDDEVVPGQNQKRQYKEDDSDYENALDEEIHQVIYKESLNEAVMSLALGEERNGRGGDEESSYFDGVEGEKVGFGTGVNGDGWDGWEGNDGNGGISGNEGAMQGQYGNDEVEGEEEGTYGAEEMSGYGAGRNYSKRHHEYPLRIDAEDCVYYMRTGSCKFGMNCKFNHPTKRRNQVDARVCVE